MYYSPFFPSEYQYLLPEPVRAGYKKAAAHLFRMCNQIKGQLHFLNID